MPYCYIGLCFAQLLTLVAYIVATIGAGWCLFHFHVCMFHYGWLTQRAADLISTRDQAMSPTLRSQAVTVTMPCFTPGKLQTQANTLTLWDGLNETQVAATIPVYNDVFQVCISPSGPHVHTVWARSVLIYMGWNGCTCIEAA